VLASAAELVSCRSLPAVNDVEQLQTTVELANVPPPSLFFGLLSQRFSGRLELDQTATGARRCVRFRGGMPMWTDWEQDGSRLGELAVAQAQVGRAAIDAALTKLDGRRPLGQILVEDGALTPDKLAALLRAQCSRRLLDLFALERGTITLVAEADDHPGMLPVNVLELIHRGVTSRYDATRLRRDLGAAWGGRFRANAALERYVEQFRFRPEDGSLLGYLASGAEASIAELAAMPDASEARAAQIVAVLWHCQMLEPTSEIVVDDLERFLADLESMETRLRANQDPTAIIGVDGDATASAIDSAWLQLAARFDPRALGDDVDDDLRSRVQDVSSALDDVRAAARRRRLALTEIAGLRLMGEGKFARSLALLEEAVSLGATGPEIECAVLWGQLQTQGRAEPELRRALAALDRTLAVHPDVAAGHYYRGCVLGWLGKSNEAAGAFRRALELDPRLVDAQRQLRAVSRGERVTDVAAAPRRRPDDAPPPMGPHRPHAPPRHELLTPGYKRLYWITGILLAALVAANFILRLDADF